MGDIFKKIQRGKKDNSFLVACLKQLFSVAGKMSFSDADVDEFLPELQQNHVKGLFRAVALLIVRQDISEGDIAKVGIAPGAAFMSFLSKITAIKNRRAAKNAREEHAHLRRLRRWVTTDITQVGWFPK